jgi:MFS family permease
MTVDGSRMNFLSLVAPIVPQLQELVKIIIDVIEFSEDHKEIRPMTTNTKTRPTLANRVGQVRSVIREYPNQFWLVVGASFIDRLGGAMLFPFFTLYLTKKFGINMTTVGIIFFMFSVSSFAGSMVGGALTDRLGRKGMLLFGLVMSATSSLLMGVIDKISFFVLAALLVGVLADSAGPAQQALVADLLPEQKRAQGFGILRVVFNLAVTIGPLIGGLLATYNYLFLFAADAITSLVTAVIVFFALKETWKPEEKTGETQESMLQTFKNYGKVLQDSAFVWFLIASALMVLVYVQMNTTLAVYLRDQHGVNEQGFSYILSLNAAMVVLFQFPITRWISKYRPLMVMTVGTLLYAVGFAIYGFVSFYFFFLVAMAIITIGEMLVSPVGQAIVARLAPEEMRGRYMAVFGFSWVLPFAIGPLLAGLIFDNLNPDVLWYAAGLLGLVAAGAYYSLELRVRRSSYELVDERLRILERLEEGEISAESASQMLEKIGQGTWARLAPTEAPPEPRKMRIRISEMATGLTKVDLHLPVGLVNTVLYVGGHFSRDLDERETDRLRALIARSDEDESPQNEESDGRRVEISLE